MSERDYQILMNIAARELERAKHYTKEQALAILIKAGHLDSNGNFTEPYKILATAVTYISK